MSTPKELTADEFLSAEDIVVEKFETPEIAPGSFVYVKSISAAERGKIDAGAARYKETKGKNEDFVSGFNITLVRLGACDSKGNRLFTTADQVEKLKSKNAGMISRMSERIAALSGLSKKDLEELEKNSESAQAEGSPSV